MDGWIFCYLVVIEARLSWREIKAISKYPRKVTINERDLHMINFK